MIHIFKIRIIVRKFIFLLIYIHIFIFQQFDPSIYNELETLRSIKMNLEAEKHAYETERSGYHVQCKQQQDEIQQVQKFAE